MNNIRNTEYGDILKKLIRRTFSFNVWPDIKIKELEKSNVCSTKAECYKKYLSNDENKRCARFLSEGIGKFYENLMEMMKDPMNIANGDFKMKL